jgi:hypothetical protein
MISKVQVYQAKAEKCRVQAAIRGNTPAGRRWLTLARQWSDMAKKAK